MLDKPPDNSTYPGLTAVTETLPRSCYQDATFFETELQKIWYQNWLLVCREEDLAEPRDYLTVTVGTQSIILLRNDSRELRAYYNTCRHRGSLLLTESSGRLPSAHVVCPYHRWAYSLDGELRRTGYGSCPAGLALSDYPLLPVALESWEGFVFINLARKPKTDLQAAFDEYSVSLNNWHLAGLRSAYQYEKTLNCNWKLFWENFNECLHCPHIHPDLCKIVPLYKRGIMEAQDDINWSPDVVSSDPAYAGGLAEGASTWATEGKPVGKPFQGLTEQEKQVGHNYAMLLPSMFIVGHSDYVRSVRLLPLNAQQTLLRADWFFSEETINDPNFNAEQAAAFARQVIDEDGYVAELNQRGLVNQAYERGVLMAEEYEVHRFQQWVLRQIATD